MNRWSSDFILVGLLFLTLFGNDWYALAIAVATSIALMQFTNTASPAGAERS
ncbi:HPP family protein [Leptospira adleri]|uniref:HPP family protein n=1 Tax=Leptospira adleri TaxID=2023186 RepID=UPI001A9C3518|nr:HPP family protein [Leptospira adleri]